MQNGGFTLPEIAQKLIVTFEYTITNSSNIENPTIFINYDLVPCSETNLFKNDTLKIKKKFNRRPSEFLLFT